MDIIQISDLHICEKTREELLKNCHKLKTEIGDSPIIICGDIFDKKTYCKGEDIETLHKIFDIFVDNSVYVIPGESDFEYGSPSNLLKNIKIEKDNVTIIDENKELNIAGKKVLFLPPTDYNGISDFASNKKDYDYVVIYENDKNRLNKWIIPNSNIYLCGGIHDYKEYNLLDKDGKNNKFVYSGSLSHRFHEKNYRSYLKWSNKIPSMHDLATTDEKFYYYKENNLIKGEILEKSVSSDVKKIHLHFRKCTSGFIQNIREEIAEILDNKKNVSVEYTEIIKPNERIENISSINDNIDFFGLDKQLELIKEKTTCDKVLEIHKKNYEKYMADSVKKTKHWKIDKMYWSNLYCYKGENFLDFNDLRGLTTVIGKNGLGKTSLINIITIALYGLFSDSDPSKPPNLVKSAKNICYSGIDKWNIVLYLTTFGGEISEKYVIKRSGDNKETTISFYNILEDVDDPQKTKITNLSKHTNETTQSAISEIIGSAEDFIATNIMHQNTKYYVDRTPQEITDSILIGSYINKFATIESLMSGTVKNTKILIRKKTSEIEGALSISDISKLGIVPNRENLEKLTNERDLLNAELSSLQQKYDGIPKFVGDLERKDYTELSKFYKSLDIAKKYDLIGLTELSNILEKLSITDHELFVKYAESKILSVENYRKMLSSLNISDGEVESIFQKSRTYTVEKIEEIIRNSKLVPSLDFDSRIKVTKSEKITKNSEEYLAYKKFLEKNGGFQNWKKIENYIRKILDLVETFEIVEVEKFDSLSFINVMEYDLSLFETTKITKMLEFNDSCECCQKNKKMVSMDSLVLLKNKIAQFLKIYLECHYIDYTSSQNNIVVAQKLLKFKEIPDDIFRKINEYQNWMFENKLTENSLRLNIEKIISVAPVDRHVVEYINTVGKEKYWEELNTLQTKITDLREKSERSLVIITKLEKAIADTKKIADAKEELDKQQTRLEILEKYVKLVARDGICKDILGEYLVKLNRNINNILKCITNFTINIELCPDNLLSITIPEKSINAKLCSGGQKFIIDIAIRISLLNITKDRPKFMIIDEGFGSLDADHLENVQTFMKILDKFYIRENNWVLFVSHIDELKDISNTKISINTINNRSYIINASPDVVEKNQRLILLLGRIKSSFVPSMDDFEYSDETGTYHCKYCNKNYTKNRTIAHLETQIHKKNYSDSFN